MDDCGGCDDIEGQHRFVLESPIEGAEVQPSGQIDLSDSTNWIPEIRKLWGKFVSNSGSESQALQQTQGQRMHSIEFPYMSALIRRSSKSRLRLVSTSPGVDSRTFNITALYDVGERRKVIRVEATEPVGDCED